VSAADLKLLGFVEDLLDICGSRDLDYVFMDAAPRSRSLEILGGRGWYRWRSWQEAAPHHPRRLQFR